MVSLTVAKYAMRHLSNISHRQLPSLPLLPPFSYFLLKLLEIDEARREEARLLLSSLEHPMTAFSGQTKTGSFLTLKTVPRDLQLQ
ncbi:conserved hypothetical protein [Ricinus communis]|uniref:Uncharacterized protein n=1 Tax=Ricinus communis TaxID=3988 RepID=B9S316_RICCO|nr:conserved hypothetical protein [Ricinus communis]